MVHLCHVKPELRGLFKVLGNSHDIDLHMEVIPPGFIIKISLPLFSKKFGACTPCL